MSEELAEYGATERAERAEDWRGEKLTQRRGDAEVKPQIAQMDAEGAAPLVTTIRWHRPAEQMPPYGVTVVVWIQALGITVRAYRGIPGDMWRVAGTSVNGIHDNLITAWTDAPNGPLPPPEGGAK